MISIIKIAFITGVALTIAACGGASASGSSDNLDPSSITEAAVFGAANFNESAFVDQIGSVNSDITFNTVTFGTTFPAR
jgi:ABC-type glycerol-3-phosphate transport system substrate-binding protein